MKKNYILQTPKTHELEKYSIVSSNTTKTIGFRVQCAECNKITFIEANGNNPVALECRSCGKLSVKNIKVVEESDE